MRRKGECVQAGDSGKKTVMNQNDANVSAFDRAVEGLMHDLSELPRLKEKLSAIKGDCPGCDRIKSKYLSKMISEAESRISMARSRVVRVANRRLAAMPIKT